MQYVNNPKFLSATQKLRHCVVRERPDDTPALYQIKSAIAAGSSVRFRVRPEYRRGEADDMREYCEMTEERRGEKKMADMRNMTKKTNAYKLRWRCGGREWIPVVRINSRVRKSGGRKYYTTWILAEAAADNGRKKQRRWRRIGRKRRAVRWAVGLYCGKRRRGCEGVEAGGGRDTTGRAFC